ncbi:hypothetical protein LOK49_LG06G01044 [Camellia lanceoleosa]|uniref:Uncharacterized protein n=1 Tax=Camellia lanceoleosa TaxID=1840588 RepID=A0ACC0HBK0_9ERIC|nr:hypothetical protein LOK49_LG06G01044 [Camellia lanceoleosa]
MTVLFRTVGLGLLWVGLWAASDVVCGMWAVMGLLWIGLWAAAMGWTVGCIRWCLWGWFGLVYGLHQMVSLCPHQMVSAGLTLTSSGLLWVGLWAASDGVFGAVLGWSVGCIRWCLCVCILEFSSSAFFGMVSAALLLALFWGSLWVGGSLGQSLVCPSHIANCLSFFSSSLLWFFGRDGPRAWILLPCPASQLFVLFFSSSLFWFFSLVPLQTFLSLFVVFSSCMGCSSIKGSLGCFKKKKTRQPKETKPKQKSYKP